MKYISHRAIICTLTLLIIIITVLFTFLRSSDVPEYITAPVRKGDIENSVLATGRIDAIERVNVGAQVSGQLKWHCCKVSDEAAFCLIQRPYISKTLLTRRISPRGSP